MTQAKITQTWQSPAGIHTRISLTNESLNELLKQFDTLEPLLMAKGWQPAAIAAQAQAEPAAAPPVCNLHNKSMKRSNHGAGYYCPSKLVDGSYCKETL